VERGWPSQLAAGLEQMGLPLEPERQRRLIDYLALLYKWNRAYNLTAVRDPRQAVSRQLLDSLSILPLVAGPRVLDLGTGPGLPGVPLAIVRPQWHFTLLDSNLKKCRFLRQVQLELGLENLEVVQILCSLSTQELARVISWMNRATGRDRTWCRRSRRHDAAYRGWHGAVCA